MADKNGKTNEQFERVTDALEVAGMAKGSGDDWQCPGHDDEGPSLGVTVGDSQPVLLMCQAGCTPARVLKALGLKWHDVMAGKPPKPKPIEHRVWPYVYVDGSPAYDVHRYDLDDGTKTFRQYLPGSKSPVGETPRTLLYAPAVAAEAARGGTLWVTEGEKCADAVNAHLAAQGLGGVATTASGGSKAPWMPAFIDLMQGAGLVNVLADDDLAGWLRARTVAQSLKAAGLKYRVLRPGIGEFGSKLDVDDHLKAGKSLDYLRQLTAEEVRKAVADAEERAALVDAATWPAPNEPYEVAKRYVRTEEPTLRFWRGDYYRWAGSHHEPVEPLGLKTAITEKLSSVQYATETEQVDWKPTDARIRGVMAMTEVVAYLPASVEPGVNGIAFRNGVLDPVTRSLTEHDPDRFNVFALPYDFDADAPAPVEWLKFLDKIWPGDHEAIAALQEWFGYVLGGSTALHKLLMIVGPPRAGKGVIAHTLTELIGRPYVTSPTLESLGDGGFSGQSMIGKPLAVIADARFGGRNNAAIVERLLSISGEDQQTVGRKYLADWEGVLPTRIMMMTNVMPRLQEASSALMDRTVLLRLTESYVDREDVGLKARIAAELPGVLLWALEGLERVAVREHFTVVSSSAKMMKDLRELTSPVTAFWNECVVDVSDEDGSVPNDDRDYRSFVTKQEMHTAWRQWNEMNGQERCSPIRVFGADLQAAYPWLKSSQRRVGKTRPECWVGVTLNKEALQYRT